MLGTYDDVLLLRPIEATAPETGSLAEQTLRERQRKRAGERGNPSPSPHQARQRQREEF